MLVLSPVFLSMFVMYFNFNVVLHFSIPCHNHLLVHVVELRTEGLFHHFVE